LDKLDLIMLAIKFEQAGEPELAAICEKAARYLEEKEKSAAERSA